MGAFLYFSPPKRTITFAASNLNLMRDILQVTFGWMLVSNRPKHIAAGAIIFVAVCLIADFAISVALGHRVPDELTLDKLHLAEAVIATVSTFIAMLTVEYIQGEIDWLDILAGCLASIVGIIVCTSAVIL